MGKIANCVQVYETLEQTFHRHVVSQRREMLSRHSALCHRIALNHLASSGVLEHAVAIVVAAVMQSL